VVQVYVDDRSGVLQTPESELRAFSRVHLELVRHNVSSFRSPGPTSSTSILMPAGFLPADDRTDRADQRRVLPGIWVAEVHMGRKFDLQLPVTVSETPHWSEI
jgi:hypothetical protein